MNEYIISTNGITYSYWFQLLIISENGFFYKVQFSVSFMFSIIQDYSEKANLFQHVREFGIGTGRVKLKVLDSKTQTKTMHMWWIVCKLRLIVCTLTLPIRD